MADQDFTNGITLSDAGWFDDVNNLRYGADITARGAALLQFYGAGSTSSRTVQEKLREIVSVTDFMSTAEKADYLSGALTLNLAAAYNAAFAMTGRAVFLPKGNGRIDSNLTPPVCGVIFGEGREHSIITAATGVTKALPLDAIVALRDFKIVGNATTNAIGIIFGDTATTYACVDNVAVGAFIGTTALGVQFKQVLKSSIKDLSVTGCTKNILISGTGGLPTTLVFSNLYCGTSLGIGADILNGVFITFNQCVFESNVNEGAYVRPNVGDATEITFNDCWFEANWNGSAVQYQLKVNPDNRTARPIINNCYFSSVARALHLTATGSGATQATLNNLILDSEANQVVVDSGATGKVLYSYGNTDPAITLTDASAGLQGLGLPWYPWTPVYSSDIGNAAATFTATPTTAHARYKVIDKTLFIDITWDATLIAVTPAYIQFTLPVSNNVVNTMYRPGMTVNNGTREAGLFRGSGGNALLQYRTQSGAYTVSSAVGGFFSGTVELA